MVLPTPYVFLSIRIVLESGPFGHDGQKGSRSAARPVHPLFPLADSLLARAQPPRQLALRQAEVLAQSQDALSVPLLPPGFILERLSHNQILHGLV